MANEQDDELTAMSAIRDVLTPLDEATRTRVIRWAAERFQVTSPPRGVVTARPSLPDTEASTTRPTGDLAAFYHAASPETDVEKVLAVAYWLQKYEGLTDIDSFRVNSELKQLGFGVGNVTRAFDKLMAMRPQPVIQTRKSGTSQQARKKFRVTDLGIRTMERMLQGQSSEMEEPAT